LIVRRVAALCSSQNLTGPSLGDEPCVLKGRCGGTDEFLGRGSLLSQSPWSSGQGGRSLDKCLVQRHADAFLGKLPAAVSVAVNRSPVITTRKEDYSSPVRGAPVDRRGHISVRLGLPSLGLRKPFVFPADASQPILRNASRACWSNRELGLCGPWSQCADAARRRGRHAGLTTS
jgi:hypothetical protein